MMRTFFVPRRPAPLRRGVTLLEVLIAVGVLTIGLLGMAALIPLGRMELAEANHLDNVSTIGRAAFRDLSVRGYLRPEMWAEPINGKSIVPTDAYPNEYAVSLGSVPNTARQFPTAGGNGLKGPPYAPIVIDPLMIAPRYFGESPNANTLNDEESTHRSRVAAFPYSSQLNGVQDHWPEETVPRLARVTLRTIPTSVVGKPSQPKQLSSTMKFDTAQRFFRGTDDITVQTFDDKNLKPIQIFSVTSQSVSNVSVTISDGVAADAATSRLAYRQFQGDYSWFLVIEPAMSEAYSQTPLTMPVLSGPNSSLYSTKNFRVWTVVCHKRDLRDTTEMDLEKDRDVGERVVWVDFVDRNTVRLRIHDADRAAAERILRLKNQQWFAVMSAYPEPAFGGALRYVMEWFRVVNVADSVTNLSDHDGNETQDWFIEATVAGRDFANLGFEFVDVNEFDEYHDLVAVTRKGGADVDGGGHVEPLTAWGVIIDGVRGVYEKTLFLDTPSSWGMQ